MGRTISSKGTRNHVDACIQIALASELVEGLGGIHLLLLLNLVGYNLELDHH